MAISHELSTDIATALLTTKTRSPGELVALKQMLLEVHATLERLAEKRSQDHPETQIDSFSKARGAGG